MGRLGGLHLQGGDHLNDDDYFQNIRCTVCHNREEKNFRVKYEKVVDSVTLVDLVGNHYQKETCPSDMLLITQSLSQYPARVYFP